MFTCHTGTALRSALPEHSIHRNRSGYQVAGSAAGCLRVTLVPVSYTHLDVYKRQILFTSQGTVISWPTIPKLPSYQIRLICINGSLGDIRRSLNGSNGAKCVGYGGYVTLAQC